MVPGQFWKKHVINHWSNCIFSWLTFLITNKHKKIYTKNHFSGIKSSLIQKVLDDLIKNSLPSISNETRKSIFNDQQDFTEEFWIQKQHFAAENRKANWDQSMSSTSNHANSRKWVYTKPYCTLKKREITWVIKYLWERLNLPILYGVRRGNVGVSATILSCSWLIVIVVVQ